ncbi:MAG TPA: mandelate racemase/muconate lactonizing enzyme family protein, partial [Chloroflexota bacterium]|nr:mandelate racemase/muconate lactonizing enzyme family protein [Chloroflexota bacterium]
MKIASLVIRPVRVTYDETVSGTHVLLRLQTDEGVEGVSFVSRIGGTHIGPLAQLIEATAQRLCGEEVLDSEAFYAKTYRDRLGGLLSGLEARAASAVETAAWDLRGKALGQPVWRLLGGFRNRLPVSANWGLQHGPDRATLEKQAQMLLDAGFRAIKFQVGFLDRTAALAHMQLMREIVGPDVRIIVDANQRWTTKQAIAMGRALGEYDPYWIEDPVVAHDVAGLREVREALDTRICAGEVYHSVPQFLRLLQERAADQVMIDQDLGLSGFVRVAHLAEAHGLSVVNHLASEVLAHGVAAVPNGLIVGFYPWAQPL